MAFFGFAATVFDIFEPMAQNNADITGVKICAWGSVAAESLLGITGLGHAGYKKILQYKNKKLDCTCECVKDHWPFAVSIGLTGVAIWLDIWYNLLIREDDWKAPQSKQYCLYSVASLANLFATYFSIYNHVHIHRGRPAGLPHSPVTHGHGAIV